MVFFTLQLVMFFAGIRSERKLIETASRTIFSGNRLRYPRACSMLLDDERPA